MITRCREAGLAEPQFAVADGFVITLRRHQQRAFEAVTGEVPRKYPASTPQVLSVLEATVDGERSREGLQEAAGIRDREHFRRQYLEPLLSAGLLERTIPDRPRSSRQKYRLTAQGRAVLEKSREGKTP